MNIYYKDENNQEILLSNTNQQIMMEWEKPYMEASIDMLQPKGHVLEVGFGLGYSASQIMKYNPKSYTIIECDPIVIKKIKEWTKNYPNTPINIIEGRWQQDLHTLGRFDQIYFDDYPLNLTKDTPEIERIMSRKRLSLFIDFCIQNHTRVGSKISFYLNSNTTENVLSSDSSPFVKITMGTIEIEIPENCTYRNRKEQKCTIPLVEKIRVFDYNYANKKAEESILMTMLQTNKK